MIERLLDLPLYRLQLPTPFPVGAVNVYLITEPEVVLLDTGTASDGTLQLLEKQLAAAGVSVEDIRKVVVSHGHLDHYGLAQPLADRSGAQIYAPASDERHFRSRHSLAGFYRAMFEQAAMPPAAIAAIMNHFARFDDLAASIREYRPIEELGDLRIGPLKFQAVHTPGHTQGSTSFFNAERRILLSSDTVLKHITPNPILDVDPRDDGRRFRALAAYLESLERIAALRPAIIFTGHGDPVEDFPELHQRVLRHHQDRQQKLLACLSNGGRTVYDLAGCLFPDPLTHNSFLAISEVYAHIDLLVEHGNVRIRRENGRYTYEPVVDQ